MSSFENIRAAYDEQLERQRSDYEKIIAKYQEIINNQRKIIEQLNNEAKTQTRNNNKSAEPQKPDKIQETKIQLLQSQIDSLEKQLKDEQNEKQDLQAKLKQQEDTIEQLQASLDENNFNGAKFQKQLSLSLKKLKALKAKVTSLEDSLNQKNTENLQLDTLISELKLQSSRDQEVIEQLKSIRTRDHSQSSTSLSGSNAPDIRETINSMEELLKNQNCEITELVSQRSHIISQFYNMQSVLETMDKNLISLQKQNSSLQKSLQEKDTEYQQYKETESLKWKQSIDKILKSLPSTIKINIDFESDTKEAILDKIFAAVLSYQGDQMKVISCQQNETDKNKDLISRHFQLISHLISLMNWLKQITGTSCLNDNDKKAVFTQCARIQCFLDQEDQSFLRESCPDLFSQRDELQPEDVAKIFYDFVGQKNVNASPFIELRILLCGILQMNKLLMNQNEQLRNFKQPKQDKSYFAEKQNQQIQKSKEIERQNIQIAQNLRKFTSSNSENIEELFAEFINHIKSDVETTQTEHQKQLSEKDAQIKKLQSEIQEKENHFEEQRKIFTDRATDIVNNIQQQISDIKQETTKDMKKLKAALKAKDKELVEAKSELTNLKETQEQQSIVINESRRDLENERDLLENELNDTREKLQEEQNNHNEEVAELKSTIDQLEKALQVVSDKCEKETKRKMFYKQRMNELQGKTQTNIDEIREKNKELNTKYVSTLEELTNKLNETRKENENLKKTNEEYAPYKKDLEMKLAKATASERTLKLKLQAANDAIANIKSEFEDRKSLIIQQNNAKISQINNENDQRYEKFTKQIEKIISLLGKEKPQVDSVDELINYIINEIQSRNSSEEAAILNDAISLRNQLNIKSDETLFTAFTDICQERDKALHDRDECINDARLADDRANQAEREKQRFVDSIQANKEWEKWTRSLFASVNGIDPTSVTVIDAKRGIKESILSLAGNNQIMRKMEILRFCKSVSLKFRGDLNRRTIREKVTSLRPMMICAVFVRRLNLLVPTQTTEFHPPVRTKPLVNTV
ncbi:hypothetical protein TVAG_329900 [Trichomonas vaginalis G3]|uniref:Uncharacterized protein n=1 Tax=Trichomonas vaginalis (strain ATCC PRA-98 / G3) TaxID=412133 RepID=A2FQT6_TRIV3|nr:A-type inclusion protein, putative-related family [Trichomonas vaginalis G3]EAX92729.1 hypothetical protein TVAG_329900 [Trichomonas vaginalis G3]KAI5482352.1 A-type inclusion protein, putative-related family [Trichomonas vaginalis G3]|eukprot:XP_001305659.1 hypothetical protein [Trichomonas vaginalis G3]